jgi:hypothetical protein
MTALRAAGPGQIEQAISARSPRIAVKVTAAVMAALAAQDLTLPAEAAAGRVIAGLAGELSRVTARRDTLAARIEEAFLARPFGELLASMPGIGPRTGARILAEIGDGTAFADGGKLAAYASLAPVSRQSGKSLDSESQPPRQPPAQERHVPRRLRVRARPGVQGVLRPQASRGQTPQRRADLPGPPPLRRHRGHAPHRPAIPAAMAANDPPLAA